MSQAPPSPPTATDAAVGDGGPPARPDGVQLIGEMAGSGYRVPPALARRADGQTVQLTPLLYATLAALDGVRSYADVAHEVGQATGRPISEDNARELVDKLRPLGLARAADGSEPELPRSNPLLALRLKVVVSDPERTRRITTPFARLFHLAIVVPVLAAFAWITWWILFEKGLASATHEAFARPGLLLAVLAITVFSAGFHEFGHAAAARRGGATPGVMGAGLYLVWPAFYTDVTDSYRLGRGGRLRTDLGGLYFNAIIAVATVGVWWATGYDALLLLVATQLLQMLRQLLPIVRFDGYHVLADLVGVPDLFQRIGPTLRALVPWRPTEPAARSLKPWARAVVTAWVLLVVPLLAFVLLTMVLTLPRIAGTAWAAAGRQREGMAAAFGGGDVIEGLARAAAMVIVVLPIAAIAYLLVRVVRGAGTAIWRRTDGRPVRRALAVVVAAALVAGLGAAWWPDADRYRPVQAYEGGTVGDVMALARPAPDFGVGAQGRGAIAWPSDRELPTRERPQLAAILVPTEASASERPDGSAPEVGLPDEGETALATDDTWIFPFDEPLAPEDGDNQALAVNTTDGSTTYSVAFALVWADGEAPLENTNEAYALTSCTECSAVAVAFQVVLVVGETNSVAPVNVSVAANYECSSCMTFSLAVQLFVTLDGPLSDLATNEINTLWEQIVRYGENIGQEPLDQIQSRLSDFERQILAIIEKEQGPLTDPAATPSPSPSESPTSTESPTPPVTAPPSPTTSTGPAPTEDPSAPTTPPSPTPSEPSAPPPTAPTTPPPTAPTTPPATTTPTPAPTASAAPTPTAAPSTTTSPG